MSVAEVPARAGVGGDAPIDVPGVPLEVREHAVDAKFGNDVGVLVRPEGAA